MSPPPPSLPSADIPRHRNAARPTIGAAPTPRSSDSHLQTGALVPSPLLRRLRGCAFQTLSFPVNHPSLTCVLICRSESAVSSRQRAAAGVPGVRSSPRLSVLTCTAKRRPGRRICTLSLCTMHRPIDSRPNNDDYLNPSTKKHERISLCVCK